MSDIRDLLERARYYFAQSHRTSDPDAKLALQELGKRYLREADNVQRYQTIQARFPKTGVAHK